jgi:hypothetical protein
MYSINLYDESNNLVRSYKNYILPVVGDFIKIDENTLFRVDNRILSTYESNTIMLTGSLVPNIL